MLIRTENLVKKYDSHAGEVIAVNRVSLEVEPKKLTILRGKSGSGKTTLINLLGTLDYPNEGKIWFENREITTLSNKERDILRRTKMGFVFQSVALFNEMTAYENVEFEMRISGIKGKDCEQRVLDCLDMVGLGERAKHMPQELSGGEQQRVAIARSISHSPSVIFADEPTAQLDSQMSIQIVEIFLEMIRKEGITVVMTTHDPDIIDYAHCVYTLNDGEVTDEPD
ncbi:MAG: ABC transporter ATP-binding protein [Oscillospiraceae bacterium]|nr:ABC transporter ATP-binding protein [Oscillospiraceae bacterium]